jgi:hypothetical protein
MPKIKALITASVASAFLLGCGNLGYVFETYSAKNRTFFEQDGKTWWVYDRPDLNRVMVNAPIGDSMVSGATFGLAEPQYTAFTKTGRAFLASTGRDCTLSEGREVVSLQVEFNYVCK